jgi:hypothetical protein
MFPSLVEILIRLAARRRDLRGQTTAEYALVLVVAATLGGLVLAWASRTHAIARLFDVTIGKVVELAG